ncbi:hypothetical protein ACP8HZ_06790 [Francisella noatunensis]
MILGIARFVVIVNIAAIAKNNIIGEISKPSKVITGISSSCIRMRLFLNVVCGDKYLCNFPENN